MKNIYLLCGGISSEHEISLRSAQSFINNLDRKKYKLKVCYIDKEGFFVPLGDIGHLDKPEDLMKTCKQDKFDSIKNFIDDLKGSDVLIPVIHGTSGEDGQIQGFLQTLDIAYVGNGILPSAVCMDKAFTNQILEVNHIPEAKYLILDKFNYEGEDIDGLWDRIENACGPSVFVKPCNNGSSVGVMRADKSNIKEAIENAFNYDTKILIEEEMKAIELEVSVFGNDKVEASLPGSYATNRDFFDYEAKYLDRALIRNVPHDLGDDKNKEIRNLAIKAYKALNCRGFARVDIFMDSSGKFYVNEINTFPGMTFSSLSADLWKVTDGSSFSDLIDRLLDLAIEEKARRDKITKTI